MAAADARWQTRSRGGVRRWAAICAAWPLLAGLSCSEPTKPREQPKKAQQERAAKHGIEVIDEPAPRPEPPRGVDHFAPENMPAAQGAGSGQTVYALAQVAVPECDRLIKTLNECYMPKLSDQNQVRVLATLKQQYKSWSGKAGEETQRAQAAATCQKAFADRRDVFVKMGCSP